MKWKDQSALTIAQNIFWAYIFLFWLIERIFLLFFVFYWFFFNNYYLFEKNKNYGLTKIIFSLFFRLFSKISKEKKLGKNFPPLKKLSTKNCYIVWKTFFNNILRSQIQHMIFMSKDNHQPKVLPMHIPSNIGILYKKPGKLIILWYNAL